MKYVTSVILCMFLACMSGVALADEPVKVEQPEQSIETEAAGEREYIKEAKELPSTLMTGEEEKARVLKEVDELKEQYIYDEDPHD